MDKKARYICIEGTEGVGKTTQTNNLVKYLQCKGYDVLQTKEPGTPLAAITMQLRSLMLDNRFDKQLTPTAREFLSQAIRSIHLEKVVYPAFKDYDFIVQDRGILSGLAYGEACGNAGAFLMKLTDEVINPVKWKSRRMYELYDDVIYLKGGISKGLDRALSSKQEFKDGDAMESRGVDFLNKVSKLMDSKAEYFNTKIIVVDNYNEDEVFQQMLKELRL